MRKTTLPPLRNSGASPAVMPRATEETAALRLRKTVMAQAEDRTRRDRKRWRLLIIAVAILVVVTAAVAAVSWLLS